MSLGDLVFLAAALTLLGSLARVAWHLARRQWTTGRTLVGRIGIAIGLYVAVVGVVSVATPQPWIALGEEQRFDDWCITVASVDHDAGGYRVRARIANRGRGRTQRAADANLVLVAAGGRTFEPRDGGPDALRVALRAGESRDVDLRYAVPVDTMVIGVDVIHGAWPQWLIIGDRGSLFHPRPLVRLE